MEEARNKRTADTNREKFKKKNAQEKKTKSDTTTFSSGSSVTDPSLESIIVIGKGCSYGKSKPHDSGYRLHECYSETSINPPSENSLNVRDIIQGEGLQPVPSNSSFLSAMSDFSDTFQKRVHDLEEALIRKNLVINSLKKQLGGKEICIYKTVSTETDLNFDDAEEHKSKVNNLEKKISSKEKKIKDLNQKLEECSKDRDIQIEEKKGLTHQINLLNRQLQSMFEFLGKKNWNSIDPTEFAKYKNKTVELEALIASHEQEKNALFRKIEIISSDLESKEIELNAKAREIIDYKNRSTLEMCKLINQIDGLQIEAKNQSQLLDAKITEAQNSMDEEIMSITQKLEEQYQKDVKGAIEKFHADFERLADLPKTAIEKLLRLCESDQVDFISYQKEWNKQQTLMEAKIESMQINHNREITQLKDNYESKIVFLKTQVDVLLSQLKERKDILDIFENELMVYKSNSSMNILKASSLSDDFYTLKELYTAEIFSQKQVHKLQVNIFEEKVKTLTEEILYRAKNEEIHLQELENAKKIAIAFRERYERLVFEWEERVEKEIRSFPTEIEVSPELDSMIREFKNLIVSLKKSEQSHEERLKKIEVQNENEKFSLMRDVEDFKIKLQDLNKFQKTQVKLDETIQDLIKKIGVNYTKTVEALLMSHITELTLKHLEMCVSETRHAAEIDSLKNDHEKNVEELRNKIQLLEDSKLLTENELASLKKINGYEEIEMLKKKNEEISVEFIKSEGMIAIKEETEQALHDRIKELENILKLKEENCQKECEDLMAKYVKAKILSSAKDDLIKELEDKINDSETLLEKSCKEVDRFTEIYSSIEEKLKATTSSEDKTNYKAPAQFGAKFQEIKIKGQCLKTKLIETLQRMEYLDKLNVPKKLFSEVEEKLRMDLKLISDENAVLKEERNYIEIENNKMKKEIYNLLEEIAKKEKIIAEMEPQKKLSDRRLSDLENKFEVLKGEKEEVLSRVKAVNEEKKEILERNKFLEGSVRDLTARIDTLMAELAGNKDKGEQEILSINLQEVRFLYEEEQETTTTSTVACQAQLPAPETQCSPKRISDESQEEKSLILESREKEVKMKISFYEEMMDKFENIQRELCIVINERDKLLITLENLEKERDVIREELESLREENYIIRARYEAKMKIFAEKGVCLDGSGIAEMYKEIGRLTEYIESLSNKLDAMKSSNELLLSQSHDHLRHNQNLVDELEEAWSQRYEIEDQLVQVRKENALLNMHRRQLEETNKRISSLVAEGKPSVASFIKIHETVENVVDEVLALKTSFNDLDSLSRTSSGFDFSSTNPDLKFMTETLHVQLKNKTILCDELIIQKDTLQKELKNLENLMQEGDSTSVTRREVEESCGAEKSHVQKRQPAECSSDRNTDRENPHEVFKSSESFHLTTLNKLKKHLEDQVEMEEVHFRESLEVEVQQLKKEIQQLEECPKRQNVLSGDGSVCLKSVELIYEEEVVKLTKEFENEVEKLKEAFGSEQEDESLRKNYEMEIDKLKNYFSEKWADLKNLYTEMYSIQKQKKLNFSLTPELNYILEQFRAILHGENREEQKEIKIENLLKNVVNQRDEEMKSLREKYEEALTLLEIKHAFEIQRLQFAIFQLKELKREGGKLKEKLSGNMDKIPEDLLGNIRTEYEEKLKEEKKKLCDLLEDARQKHEREILALEEFWTEKLSDCETKCALIKAAGPRKTKSQGEIDDSLKQFDAEETEVDELFCEKRTAGEKQIVRCIEEIKDFNSDNYRDNLRIEKANLQSNLCVSCLASQSIFKRMDLKTDDDKLDVIRRRDTLEEMISSMRNVVVKLLTFINQHRPDMNNSFPNTDDTMYKSIHIDLDRTETDASVTSNGVLLGMDLSSVFQEIKDNSLLNSSDQIRFELDKCLKQLKKDATCLLTLSCPENACQNLNTLVKKIEKEKNELEAKVLKVEEMQSEMKRELNMTKDKLYQWERNLEVVSEGFGEEVVELKEITSLSDVKDKLKILLTEKCDQSSQDINLLEEICKEGDRLREEWMKEKCDLQQQIDVADKQLQSLKKFLEEQAVEREQERETFDREINKLQENLKAKERDSSLQIRTNREVGRLAVMPLANKSVEALIGQVKELTARLAEVEKNKGIVEGEFQNAVKKIWSLREVIQDLEVQLAEVSERENNLKKKIEKLDKLIEEHSAVSRTLKEELDTCRSQNELKYSEHVRSLEEELTRLRHIVDQVNSDGFTQLKANLRQIEVALIKKTKDLEQVHVSSASVSCSSPSEDVSIRDHLDATRCSTPDEMCSSIQPSTMLLPMEEIERVHEKLARHTRAEEVAVKYIQDLKMQLRNHRKAFEEIQTERDVLLEKVDVYLKENSSLKVRLEEQRCNAGLLQKQLNANLESQISRLEGDVEKLNELCNEKDKQLRNMKVLLENTTKSLKIRETEALNKSKEESTLITTLKTDLENALNENEKLEEKLKKTKEKLRETLKMPSLIDTMIDEKNAEIDRLEKEVERLSSEKTNSSIVLKNCSSGEKHKRKIRFSEPDSFSENISSISPQCLSDMRNCSDSYADFRNSSFKIRRPVGSSTKLESVSSIAPLQLSPRGADSAFNWKTSSPIFQSQTVYRSPAKGPSVKQDFKQMEETSKLQEELDLKQREISELYLEVDILKRQLVEASQEVATAKSCSKEMLNDLTGRDEEIRKLKNNEKSLLMTIECLKKNHAEELEELHNKLSFEHGKVEKVYEEIKALEVKKIEIEESFLSLKEDYNEKINVEKKSAEALLHRIKSLEAKNGEAELRWITLEKELENTAKKSEKTIQMLSKEISDLKNENEKIRSVSGQKANAETQVEGEVCSCPKSLTFEMPATKNDPLPFRENFDELKAEFEKMAAVIGERDFNKREAFSYAMAVKRLLSVVLSRVDELSKEVEAHMKKVMECSVDDLAVKVQKELVLSVKLDNQLLSSIEANGFASKEGISQSDSFDLIENVFRETGGGDSKFIIPKPLGNAALLKVATLYKDLLKKLADLEKERENLEGKVSEKQKIIRLLEENLKKEKERIFEEKERCSEDAKIMELLRVNLEKRLHDIKTKEKELKKEKQQRMALEKEIENYKKQDRKTWESKKIMELNTQLESQREKLMSVSQLVEQEKQKNQELRLALEEEKIERMAEKNAQRMMENDLTFVKEQKENFKKELLNARKLIRSRNVEIGLLKRKINLQEIDIKALSLSSNIQNSSDISSVTSSNAGNLNNLNFNSDSPSTLLFKMRKLNSCVQRHVKESTEMGEALLYLSQEAEQMRGIIRKLEENSETKMIDETLVPDIEVERKLWTLEKGRLVMDLETLKRENEILKHDLIDTCKQNDELKQENSRLKKEVSSPKKEDATNQIENDFLQERVSHWARKYLRTESYRKALAWQKHYLLIILRDYQRSEEEAWRKMGRRKKEGKRKGPKPCGKFRVIALAALAIFRMKFIVKRWQKNALSHVFSLPETQKNKLKLAPVAPALNIYSEPVNPLSYQTQHIFRQSPSQVLRTPPSRDPGLRGFSLDSKNAPDHLDKFDCLQENVGILKGLP